MEQKTYFTIDRGAWPKGPWDTEPDKVQWPDEATGLPCLAVRNRYNSGHWCGYVGVAEGHPAFGLDYNEVDVADVHGGLTFAAACNPGEGEAQGICHVPGPGEPDHVWWLGFDCHHGFDAAPGDDPRFDYGGVYRTLGYVRANCAVLAEQLAGMKAKALT